MCLSGDSRIRPSSRAFLPVSQKMTTRKRQRQWCLCRMPARGRSRQRSGLRSRVPSRARSSLSRAESDHPLGVCEGYRSERQSRTDLNFPTRRHRHGDCAELRCIHKPVRCSQIDFVQGVEGFTPKLQAYPFGKKEGSSQRYIESLLGRTVHGISSCVPECKSGGRCESRRVEPHFRSPCSRTEGRL